MPEKTPLALAFVEVIPTGISCLLHMYEIYTHVLLPSLHCMLVT